MLANKCRRKVEVDGKCAQVLQPRYSAGVEMLMPRQHRLLSPRPLGRDLKMLDSLGMASDEGLRIDKDVRRHLQERQPRKMHIREEPMVYAGKMRKTELLEPFGGHENLVENVREGMKCAGAGGTFLIDIG